jgi:hypothetical protein
VEVLKLRLVIMDEVETLMNGTSCGHLSPLNVTHRLDSAGLNFAGSSILPIDMDMQLLAFFPLDD